MPDKFCRLHNGQEFSHKYGNLFFRQPCGKTERLVIGPDSNHVDLLIELSGKLKGHPWYILYVLLIPRRNNRPPGRYASPPLDTHEKLSAVLYDFKAFFETDGRHHIWIGSGADDGLLIYDQHNVIFAYGPMDSFENILNTYGFKRQDFWFPSPHAHSYLSTNDAEEERLMAQMHWEYFPLQESDEW